MGSGRYACHECQVLICRACIKCHLTHNLRFEYNADDKIDQGIFSHKSGDSDCKCIEKNVCDDNCACKQENNSELTKKGN